MAFLRRMKLTNYKAVSGLSIDFSERLTVLIGENGVGKSSVLEAANLPVSVLDALVDTRNDPSRVQRSLGGEDGFERRAWHPDQPIEMEFESEAARLSIQWRFERNRVDSWRVTIDGAELRSEQFHDHNLRRSFVESLQSQSRTLFKSTYFRFDLASLSADSAAPTAEPTLTRSGRGLPSVLSWLASTHRPSLDRIERLLSSVVPSVQGISIVPARVSLTDDVQISAGGNQALFPVERSVGGHSLRFRVERALQLIAALEMSEGTLLTLAILTAIAAPGDRTVILIDDIDRGLHPKAQATLVKSLRTLMQQLSFLQIICTTHSPYLLDHFEEPEIRVLARTETGVETRRMRTHPDWDRLGASMGAGEFWSTVGEEWAVQ